MDTGLSVLCGCQVKPDPHTARRGQSWNAMATVLSQQVDLVAKVRVRESSRAGENLDWPCQSGLLAGFFSVGKE